MKKVFETIEKKIRARSTEACAYRENTRVISEEELKEILESADKDIDWIPVTQKLPENDKNVRVTAVMNDGRIATGIGWYNRHTERWQVCFDADDAFYWGEVLAWKENTDEPYRPKDLKKTTVTNADRIRSMTDEELMDAMFKNTTSCISEIVPFCSNKKECEEMLETVEGIPEHLCRKCLLEWLQKPEGGVPE